MTTETTAPAGTREQALAAIDTAEKALYGTSSRGSWEHSTRLRGGRRGLVTHVQTGDILGEFDYAADARHAAQWQPRTVQALINRDRATLERHYWCDACAACDQCGSDKYPSCAEADAVIAFWTAPDRPEIVPLLAEDDNRQQVHVQTVNTHPAIVGEDLGYFLSEYPSVDLATVRLIPSKNVDGEDCVRIEARLTEPS